MARTDRLQFGSVDGDGIVPMAGLGADVVKVPDGVELRWHWQSRHEGSVWSFDATGALVTITPATGG